MVTIFLGHPQRFQAWQRACILLESGFLMARRLPTTAPSVVLSSCSGRASRCCPSPNDREQVSRDVHDRDCSANSDECRGVCRSRWNRSNISKRKRAKCPVCRKSCPQCSVKRCFRGGRWSASAGSPGSGWSVKEKGLQVSKLHGCVKCMALVEGPGKSNTNLQCANPTYRPFPDARPVLN